MYKERTSKRIKFSHSFTIYDTGGLPCASLTETVGVAAPAVSCGYLGSLNHLTGGGRRVLEARLPCDRGIALPAVTSGY